MPLNVRAKGVSLSTATNWAFNWIVGEVTPYLQERIQWRLYPMHGFFCMCSFVLVYFCKCWLIFDIGVCGKDLIFAPQCIQKRRAFLSKRWTRYLGKVSQGGFVPLRIFLTSNLLNERCIAELQEEQLESELDDARASLVPRGRRSGSGSYSPARSRREDGDGSNHIEKVTLSWSWLARLFGDTRRHINYEPIIANDV